MEPLKPSIKQKILATTDATPQEVDEYENLLVKLHARRMSARHKATESGLPPAAAPWTEDPDEARAKELHAKFFGPTSDTNSLE